MFSGFRCDMGFPSLALRRGLNFLKPTGLPSAFVPTCRRNPGLEYTIELFTSVNTAGIFPEKAYLGNLWKSTMRAFDLPDPFRLPDSDDVEKDEGSGRTSRVRSFESSSIQICQNVWRLFEVAQFLELAPIDLWELSDPDIRTLLGWLDVLPDDIQRSVWMRVFDSIPLSRL